MEACRIRSDKNERLLQFYTTDGEPYHLTIIWYFDWVHKHLKQTQIQRKHKPL